MKYGEGFLMNCNPHLQRYGRVAATPEAASGRKMDLIDTTIAVVDEEKDPRCLMLSFNIIKVCTP
jgi:hypothetical protein